MANSTGNFGMWGFLRYARANPFNSLNSVHFDELDAMAKIFARVNESDFATGTEADPGTYGTEIDIPGMTTVNENGSGISFTNPTSLLTDRARYPESHTFAFSGAPI